MRECQWSVLGCENVGMWEFENVGNVEDASGQYRRKEGQTAG